ncbi:MAG: hypothetical protein K6G22_04265 [Lachnospiraceae bacterium]|nr:hypothetical protein [Lachnospiraceae bacterium]
MNALKPVCKKYLPAAVFVLSAVILIIKCFYGFCWSDESFYHATTLKFFQGDSIFKNDWFPTQLSSIILLPLFSLYMKINGGSEGIILYFRILFVVFSVINSVILYNVLKKHIHIHTALPAAVCMLFYTHLNIATLSYYTLSTQCFVMAMLFVYDYAKDLGKTPAGSETSTDVMQGCAGKRSALIIAGVYFAISVLALPTMALGYVLFVLAALVLIPTHSLLNRLSFVNIDKKILKDILIFTFFGILIPAVLFFIFMFLNVKISDFIANIPYVLSDDEHGTSLLYPIRKFFISITQVFGKASYLSGLIIFVSFVFQKKLRENKNRIPKLIILILLSVLFFYDLTIAWTHTGYVFTALCLFALPLFFMTEKHDTAAFFTFFAGGMLFSLVYSYSSNGYLYVLSMGHFIAAIAGFIFIDSFVGELSEVIADNAKNKENTHTKSILPKLCLIITIAVITLTPADSIYLRINNIYRDAPLNMLTQKIKGGPAKGLYTTKEHLEAYNTVLHVISEYCMRDNINEQTGCLLISKLLPFGYLCSDLKSGAPTAWRNMISSERLMEYYELNPDKIPDVVLILDKEYGAYDTCGDVEADPSPNENELSGPFMDYLNDHGYICTDVECGTVYRR